MPTRQEQTAAAQEAETEVQAAQATSAENTGSTQGTGGSTGSQQAGGVDALPDWAQEEIRGLRKEAAAHRTAKKEAEEQAKAAEEARLERDRQFEDLATKRQERIAELEPQADLAEKLSEWAATQANAQIEAWPEEVKAMLPTEAPVLEFLQAIERARPLAQKLLEAQEARSSAPGSTPRPGSAGPAGQGAARQEIRREIAANVARRF